MKYQCSNGHDNYADVLPERCPLCGSSLLRILSRGPGGAAISGPPVPKPGASTGVPGPARPTAGAAPRAPIPPVLDPAWSKSKRRWLLIALGGVMIGVIVLGVAALGGWWLIKHRPVAKPAGAETHDAGTTNAAARLGEWSPVVLMGGEIFPSYLIASATMNPASLPQPTTANRLGDPAGLLGATITSPADHTKVRLAFAANTILQASAIEVELPKKGETYLVCPKINYQYEVLLRTRQAVPLALVADVTIGNGRPEQKSLTVRLNSINDCPFFLRDGPDQDRGTRFGWMFAAYVNENHPWSEEVRRDALKSGIVKAFAGYQVPPEGVLDQVFSIWHVFQNRGFKYSDITTTSSENGRVVVQQVRFVDQCIQAAQANCADGSVLFASVLRQIGIEPVLVSVPGHMFVGFYLTEQENLTNAVFLETTMMGDAGINPKGAASAVRKGATRLTGVESVPSLPARALAGLNERLKSHTFNDATIQRSYDSFQKALRAANEQFNQGQAAQQARVISIREARQKGVTPIAYQP
jgi:hypothetical protein